MTWEEISKHQVVLANHVPGWGRQSDSPMNNAFERFMEERGGGLVLLHGSGDSQNATWIDYRLKLHPVNYMGEGNITPGAIFRLLEAGSHPILEGGILYEDQVINGNCSC